MALHEGTYVSEVVKTEPDLKAGRKQLTASGPIAIGDVVIIDHAAGTAILVHTAASNANGVALQAGADTEMVVCLQSGTATVHGKALNYNSLVKADVDAALLTNAQIKVEDEI